jgi:plastocyanin
MAQRLLRLLGALAIAGAASFGAMQLLRAATPPGFPGAYPSFEVEVSATEFAFDPSEMQVSSSEAITVVLRNNGRAPHDITFELDGGREEQSDTVRGGEVVTLTFTAPAMEGRYKYYCSIGSHEEQGMVGTLVVGDPPAAFEVVASDLANPRGLALAGNQGEWLLVAEGGTAPDGDGFRPGNGDGSVTRVLLSDPTTRTTLVEGLTNAADPGGGVIGANHAFTSAGRLVYLHSGGPGHPDPKAKVMAFTPPTTTTEIADLWEFEEANNPDGTEIDSNPWRAVQAPDDLYVTDAGGNSVVRVDSHDICAGLECLDLYAVFEPVGTADDGSPISAVATGIAWAESSGSPSSGGDLYVALLGSFAPGEGQVRRLTDLNEDGDALDEGENVLVLDGLTTAVDLAYSPDGRLFVLEFGGFAAQGRLTEVTPDGPGVTVEGLNAASAVVFDPSGDALVAVGTSASGLVTSRVVRVPAEQLEPIEVPTPTPTDETTGHHVYLPRVLKP